MEHKPSSRSHPARPRPGSPGGLGPHPDRDPLTSPWSGRGGRCFFRGRSARARRSPCPKGSGCQGLPMLEAHRSPGGRYGDASLRERRHPAPSSLPPPPPAHRLWTRPPFAARGARASPLRERGGKGGGGGEAPAGVGWADVPPRRARRWLRHVSREAKRRERRKRRPSRRGARSRRGAGAARPGRDCREVLGSGAGTGTATGTAACTAAAGPHLALGFGGRRCGRRPSRLPAALSRVRRPAGCEGALR